MKAIIKFVLAVAAAFLLFNNLQAQSSVGIRGGASFFTIKNLNTEGLDPDADEKMGYGNYSAVSFEIGLAPMFAIQPELSFLQKTGRRSYDDVTLKFQIDYIEAPVLAKLRLGSGNFRGYVVGGPSVGYAIAGRTTVTAGDFEAKDKYNFDDDYGSDGRKDNRFDISAVLGGGIQYHIGIGSIVLDARAAYDFNDFNNFSGGEPSGHKATRWEGVMVSLGYQFDLGGK